MTADAATIRSAVEAYPGAFSRRDREALLQVFAEDAWIEDPVGSPRHEGREALRSFFDQTRSMADTIELRLTGPIRVAAGECAFPMQALPDLGGTRFVMDIIDVMTFDDAGLITTMRAFFDAAEMRPAED
jgi:steroid delta-isomerase